MKKFFIAVLPLVALSACGAPSTSQSSQQGDSSLEAAWSTRETVEYKGNEFEFARNAESPVAYVQASSRSFKYTVADVEALTRSKTGCDAELDAGALAVISGFGPDADLSIVSYRGKPFRWSVRLSC